MPNASASCDPSHIVSLNEQTLHAQLKDWYAGPGDAVEVPLGHYFIDVVRGDLLIEIQTRGFASIRRKLEALLEAHRVRLVHPIPARKWIVRLNPEGEILGRRRSPKRGRLLDLFGELVYLWRLYEQPGFECEVLMTHEEEVRCLDGKGSWRRGGQSIVDRRLIEVVDRIDLSSPRELLRVLPEDIDQPFTNKELAAALRAPVRLASRATYCMSKVGVIERVGKVGNAHQFQVAAPQE